MALRPDSESSHQGGSNGTTFEGLRRRFEFSIFNEKKNVPKKRTYTMYVFFFGRVHWRIGTGFLTKKKCTAVQQSNRAGKIQTKRCEGAMEQIFAQQF